MEIQAIVTDFDGVLTDDRVWIDSNGREAVVCSRKDGFAAEILRAHGIPLVILSRETSHVVQHRARKLNVPVIVSCASKGEALRGLAQNRNWSLEGVLFIGNDLPDIPALEISGFGACPIDAHDEVKAICGFVSPIQGGHGVLRSVVDSVLGLSWP